MLFFVVFSHFSLLGFNIWLHFLKEEEEDNCLEKIECKWLTIYDKMTIIIRAERKTWTFFSSFSYEFQMKERETESHKIVNYSSNSKLKSFWDFISCSFRFQLVSFFSSFLITIPLQLQILAFSSRFNLNPHSSSL
jgi:hypothetical protein